MSEFLSALAGGVLIGLAASLLWLSIGRTAGISNLIAGLLTEVPTRNAWRFAFVGGMLVGGLVLSVSMPAALAPPARGLPVIYLTAGLLVGFGARLSNGCTSGHGVCGLSRRSLRSLAATLTFMGTGVVTVYLTRHLAPGLLQ